MLVSFRFVFFAILSLFGYSEPGAQVVVLNDLIADGLELDRGFSRGARPARRT